MPASPLQLPCRIARSAAVLALFALTRPAMAEVIVTVVDREGMPVPDVAVYLEAPELRTSVDGTASSAVMDQRDKRFVPHLLVVQNGTSVEFPNSDVIAHHVYSFSHPNSFKLPIYKGEAYPPVTFAESGVVVLGCNIHDNMLAYILVVDTPVFSKTDAHGRAVLPVDRVDVAQVSVWSPRIRDAGEVLTVKLDSVGARQQVTFQLAKTLRPPHHETAGALSWSDY